MREREREREGTRSRIKVRGRKYLNLERWYSDGKNYYDRERLCNKNLKHLCIKRFTGIEMRQKCLIYNKSYVMQAFL